MSDIEARLEAVDRRFRKGSKGNDAARYIVRQNRKITSEDRKAICQEIPIAESTLRDVFTELRHLDLYPPPKTSDVPRRTPTIEKPQETSRHVPEDPLPPMQEYATREDFETLRNATRIDIETIVTSINNLASLMNVDPLLNPGGHMEENPREYAEEDDIEVIQPEEGFIRDPSLTTKQIWIKPKTWMYFDMTRQGVFANYAGSRELGPFTDFNGDISDFFNILADDYFIRNYNADIGLLMRRYVK